MRIARRFHFLLWVCGLGVVWADWLLYGHPLGWNLGLFWLFLMAAAFSDRRCWRRREARVLAVAVAGLTLALMAQPGPLVVCMSAAGIIALALTSREGWTSEGLIWLRRLVRFAWNATFQWCKDALLYRRLRAKTHGVSSLRNATDSIRAWFFPVAGSCFFLGLFSVANPVLAGWLQEAFRRLDVALTSHHLEAGRLFFWALVAVSLWALLRVRTKIRQISVSALPAARPVSHLSVVLRCLALFNAIFAIQTLSDAAYLWGGHALPDGMTYAYYAHRGAYPLMITALLAAIFVLSVFRPSPPTRETAQARKLVYLWLAQNVFLVASAAWRLRLYMEVYSLTRLRIAAAIWMLLVAAGLVWIGARILLGHTNRWLVNRNLLTACVVLYSCCFVNFHGVIASYNVRHCREAGGQGYYLDYNYLQSLGPEAIPALTWLEKHSSVPRDRIDSILAASENELAGKTNDWRGLTYRRIMLASQMRMRKPK